MCRIVPIPAALADIVTEVEYSQVARVVRDIRMVHIQEELGDDVHN